MTHDHADLANRIAVARAASDTAARAIWRAIGSPGEYRFASVSTGCGEVAAYFDLSPIRWGAADLGPEGAVCVCVFSGMPGEAPPLNHTGTLDSCRAALAAYLGAS